MNPLLDFGIIPIDYTSLRSIYPTRKSLNDKISDLEKQGAIIRLKRGLYVVSPQISKKLVSTELIASPEKALCDQIAYTPKLQLRSIKSLQAYLEEDIRLDMDAFFKMDVSAFEKCAEVSKKKRRLPIS